MRVNSAGISLGRSWPIMIVVRHPMASSHAENSPPFLPFRSHLNARKVGVKFIRGTVPERLRSCFRVGLGVGELQCNKMV